MKTGLFNIFNIVMRLPSSKFPLEGTLNGAIQDPDLRPSDLRDSPIKSAKTGSITIYSRTREQMRGTRQLPSGWAKGYFSFP